jgi:DNA-binding transcriptional LysR family regulator
MSISLRQLQLFACAARHLSFARAAEEMHVTPPAISMQIKDLEQEVGLPLFNRSHRQLSLTVAGEYLLVHAQKIFATLKDARDVMAKLKGVAIGELAIGMVNTAVYFVPGLLSRFSNEHPGVKMVLHTGNREDLGRMLRDGELDLAIMGRPPEDLPSRSEPFAEHPLVLITHADHPFTQQDHVDLQALVQEKFIIREPGSGTRAALESFLKNNHLAAHFTMEMAGNEAIKQAVIAGMGISLLSAHTIALERHLGLLVVPAVEGLPIIRRWQLVHNQSKQLSPSAEALKAFIVENGQREIDELLLNSSRGGD